MPVTPSTWQPSDSTPCRLAGQLDGPVLLRAQLQISADGRVDNVSRGTEPGDVIKIDADAEAVKRGVGRPGDDGGCRNQLEDEAEVRLLQEVARMGPPHRENCEAGVDQRVRRVFGKPELASTDSRHREVAVPGLRQPEDEEGVGKVGLGGEEARAAWQHHTAEHRGVRQLRVRWGN